MTSATILAVDDTSESLALLVDTLAREGYQMRAADSGELALAAAAMQPPDLILLDIRMEGMDGLEVCRQLKAQEATRHIPIILLSAFAEVKEWTQGLQLGAVDYITKPFQVEELLARVRTQLTLHRAHVALAQQTAALRESDAMKDSLLRTIPFPMAIRTAQGQVVFQSELTRMTFGAVSEELSNLLPFWVPPSPGSPEDASALRHHEIRGRIYEIRRTALAFQGNPCFLELFLDITERQQAEEALLASETRYREQLDHAGEGCAVSDAQERFLAANPAAEAIFGVAPGCLLGRSLLEFLPLDQQELVRRETQVRAKGTQSTYELVIRREDGDLRNLLVTATQKPGRHGEALQVIGVFRDITDRKQVEEALRESERRFADMVLNTPGAVYQYFSRKDGTTGFHYLSPKMSEIFGLSDDPTSQDWDLGARVHPEDKEAFLASISEAILESKEWNFEGRLITPNGVMWFQGLSRPRVYEDEVLFNGILIDITERRQAEDENARLQAQLQQSQKMESLGTLASGIAHDMNNVLGAILGLASAHIGTQPYGSPLHKALDTICKATERGGRMVKSLLNFARQSPAESHDLDMNAILKEQVGLLERTTLAKVRLQENLVTELRPIRGDASALAHAFMNLCVNAVDAMPEKGTLTLHTRNVDNGWIEIVVEDDGIGMSKEVMGKAMDPFFTTKESGKGTGLGLSMVFSTVKAHNGQMTIQSEPGQGTRVALRFPACEGKAQVSPPSVSEDKLTPNGTLRVLLVDDDELMQSSVQVILGVLGHTAVTTALSGEEALEIVVAGFEPDLVILDMNMPGLGGSGTLPRLRVLRPLVPVLLSTGRTDQTALNLVSSHLGVTLLSKPFGLRELKQHLENIGLG